jgi:hypothetical protein
MGKRNVYRILLGKPKGKRTLGTLRHRWVDINMDLGEIRIGWGDMDWTDPAKDRSQWRALMKMVMRIQVP